ncbi:zonular occludens toxin domain-containing protein [Rhodoferax sp.]|uniref:zonular occludens toxin domain-containing protein n=1 Tax=Rhodoferax sp. TaxID=50421 RepID=UPI0025E2CBEC|nr:zonular occludens toxin domain-containing protein [Rhodoferax sp.]
MLTLVTGTPGAGKSLYSVWNFAKPVPGSTIENGQTAVKRRLLSNVKDLLVEHEHIEADDLNNWHTWAKPGDVILFDEVQEVWRPRGLGSKVPDCIAKLETHRHMGVDIVLVTQHPMLVDPNIRRLVNQHIHLRRIAKTVAMVYEWDHCSNPGMIRTAITSKVWWHPKAAYALYKSAQLHTKPTVRFPKIALLGVAALAALGYMAPAAYSRINGTFDAKKTEPVAISVEPQSSYPVPPFPSASAPSLPASSASFGASVPSLDGAEPVKVSGCVVAANAECKCYDTNGAKVPTDAELCPDPHAKKPVEALAGIGEPVHRAAYSNSELQTVALVFGVNKR